MRDAPRKGRPFFRPEPFWQYMEMDGIPSFSNQGAADLEDAPLEISVPEVRGSGCEDRDVGPFQIVGHVSAASVPSFDEAFMHQDCKRLSQCERAYSQTLSQLHLTLQFLPWLIDGHYVLAQGVGNLRMKRLVNEFFGDIHSMLPCNMLTKPRRVCQSRIETIGGWLLTCNCSVAPVHREVTLLQIGEHVWKLLYPSVKLRLRCQR